MRKVAQYMQVSDSSCCASFIYCASCSYPLQQCPHSNYVVPNHEQQTHNDRLILCFNFAEIFMAEIVGIIASIVQITDTGAKLSSALYNLTTSAARAEQSITDIADDVELTSNALKSVGQVFRMDVAKPVASEKAIHDANNIIKRCEAVFRDISDIIDKGRKVCDDGKSSLGKRAKWSWPLKEPRVELHRQRLESLKSSLVLLLHVLQLAQSQRTG